MFFKRSRRDKLKKVLMGHRLPSFSTTVTETLAAIRQPGSSASAIAQRMAADPGLSIKVFKLANSAAFSPARQVDNLSQAIALVGLAQVEALVLAVGVRRRLPEAAQAGLEPVVFWRAAARRAVVARALAKLLSPAEDCASFTAGFLQDMAIPLLADRHQKDYGNFLEGWSGDGERLIAFERETFGWDHAQVASWMGEFWELPERIVVDIGGHHGAAAGAPQASVAVQLAAHLENGDSPNVESVVRVAQERFGLPADAITANIETALETADEIGRLVT